MMQVNLEGAADIQGPVMVWVVQQDAGAQECAVHWHELPYETMGRQDMQRAGMVLHAPALLLLPLCTHERT